MPSINLEEVDVDGAIREAGHDVSGDTRLGFLRKAGVAGAGAVGGGAILGGLVPDAFAARGQHGRPPAKFGRGDIGILNFALTLEYLEASFYNEATAKGAVSSPQLAAFLKVVTADENAHVSFLKSALGRHGVKKPRFDFKGITGSESMFAATAQVLENTGVGAYLGQAGNFVKPAYLGAAASILTVEARHSGAIGLINDASGAAIATNGPFDRPKTAAQVLAAVAGTGFIVS